ncbi:hypothetical protein ACP3P6_08200 [Enterobacter mori]
MLPPLLGRSHKQCQYVSVFGAAGCRKGDIVMYAQVRAKPNQMVGIKLQAIVHYVRKGMP